MKKSLISWHTVYMYSVLIFDIKKLNIDNWLAQKVTVSIKEFNFLFLNFFLTFILIITVVIYVSGAMTLPQILAYAWWNSNLGFLFFISAIFFHFSSFSFVPFSFDKTMNFIVLQGKTNYMRNEKKWLHNITDN